MTLTRITPCCYCPAHQRPYVNEDGWVLTGDPADSTTWEAWREVEWRNHCIKYDPARRARRRRTDAARHRRAYHRKREAA